MQWQGLAPPQRRTEIPYHKLPKVNVPDCSQSKTARAFEAPEIKCPFCLNIVEDNDLAEKNVEHYKVVQSPKSSNGSPTELGGSSAAHDLMAELLEPSVYRCARSELRTL
jgi:hypothetical protein